METSTSLNDENATLSQTFNKFQCKICEEVFDSPDTLVNHNESNHSIPSELKCDICDFVSKSRHSLHDHIKNVHKDSRVHQCEKCPFTYSSSNSLKLHVKNIHERVKFKCDLCEKTFTLERHLLEHIRCHNTNSNDFLQCANCLGKFKRKSMKAHENTCESQLQKKMQQDLKHETWYKCELCEKSLFGILTFRGHMTQVHIRKGWHYCDHDQCRMSYPTKNKLEHHVKMNHEEPAYRCDICNKTFRYKRLYNKHIATDIHDENGDWHCELCGYITKMRSQLNEHRRIVHENKKLFKCEKCPAAYNTLSNLEMHVKNIHEGVKYKCDLCDESFTLKKNVGRHKKRVHTKNRPLVKCEKCFKDFVGNYNLRLHLKKCETRLQKRKEQEKWHKCDVCEKSLYGIKALKIHVRRLHARKGDLLCDQCDKTFDRPTRLEDHINGIHKKQPYVCDICKKTFSFRELIQFHIEKVHSGNSRDIYCCHVCDKEFLKKIEFKKHYKDGHQ